MSPSENRVLLAIEHHFERGPDGGIYAQGPPNYAFWRRCLEVFDELLVLARVRDSASQPPASARADGPGVRFAELPDYRGPREYLLRLSELRRRVRAAVRECDAHILCVPGWVGGLAATELRRMNRPFALNVVGDPWDALAPGSNRHLLRPLFRRLASRELGRQCRQAAAVCYVTRETLQRRYPPGPHAYVTHCSDVDLDGGFVSREVLDQRVSRLRRIAAPAAGEAARIGFLGSLAQLYKGPDVLLSAAALCHDRGTRLEVLLAGDGHYRPAMEALAQRLGISGHVRFLGRIAEAREVSGFLASIDLFVMPSRAEGLPRALLEAMACGCPAIAANVGGIPELLPSEFLVPPGDAPALAEKIACLLADPERLARAAERNFLTAQQYRPELLARRHREFFEEVRRRTKTSPRAVPAATSQSRKPAGARVVHVASTDMAVRFLLLNQLKFLQDSGCDVVAVSSPGPHLAAVECAGVRALPVRMTRGVFTPFADLRALFRLYLIFRCLRPDIVHTHNPKPGLLGPLAARLARVPVVVNTVHGFYFHENMHPLRRRFFAALERVAALCSDLVFSQSREDYLTALREHIVPQGKLRLLGNGISLARFTPARISPAARCEKRAALGLPPDAPLVGFVGRAVPEKGIREFFAAARGIYARCPAARFLIVELRDLEKRGAADLATLARESGIAEQLLILRDREDMPEIYTLMDVLVLPSHREGFPRVLMEAAAMGAPVVATDIRGCREAVLPEETGLLVPVRNAQALADAVLRILGDAELAGQMRRRARAHASQQFDERRIFQTIRAEYLRLLEVKGIAPRAPQLADHAAQSAGEPIPRASG